MNSEYNEVINNFEILKLFKMKDVLIEIMNQCKTDNIEPVLPIKSEM